MKYRWKLMILLLVISLTPIMIMRSLGKKALQNFGEHMIESFEERHEKETIEKLQLVVESYSSVIGTGKDGLEIALTHIANEVQSALLIQKPKTPKTVYYEKQISSGENYPPEYLESSRHFRTGRNNRIRFVKVSYENQVIQVSKKKLNRQDKKDISRLLSLTPTYQKMEKHLGNSALWFHTGLKSGIYSAYPAHGHMPQHMDFRNQPWYQITEDGSITWTAPYVDPVTRQVVIAACLPIYDGKKNHIGATGIIISINYLLEHSLLTRNMTPSTESFLAYLEPSESEMGVKARVYIKDEHTELAPRRWDYVFRPEWLISKDKNKFAAMIDDIKDGRSGYKKMSYRQKEAIWTYGPNQPDAFLCLITPYEYIVNQTRHAKSQLESEISQLLQITHYGMTLTVTIVILLSFLFSRTVTKPLQALVDGAKELASGNFDVRVHIHSKDEFGKMGEVFNLVGPQLLERYQMRQLLDVAMEVQQNLLPKRVPLIHGVDIAGKSIYCNETGGDYYDFIEKKGEGIDIVVGDVAGHGIPSALLMTTARAFIRQRSSLEGGPANIVTDVNRLLAQDIEDSGQFMTLFYAHINIREHAIRWVMAGHDPTVVYDRNSDTFETLTGKGIPLGIFDDYVYLENQKKLKKGQILIAGTDGIREAFNPKGEMFGTERLYQTIRENANENARDMITNILITLTQFQDDRTSEDDLTLVIVKVNE